MKKIFQNRISLLVLAMISIILSIVTASISGYLRVRDTLLNEFIYIVSIVAAVLLIIQFFRASKAMKITIAILLAITGFIMTIIAFSSMFMGQWGVRRNIIEHVSLTILSLSAIVFTIVSVLSAVSNSKVKDKKSLSLFGFIAYIMAVVLLLAYVILAIIHNSAGGRIAMLILAFFLISFVYGSLLLVFVDPEVPVESQVQDTPPPAPAQEDNLKRLYDSGLITKDEYESRLPKQPKE